MDFPNRLMADVLPPAASPFQRGLSSQVDHLLGLNTDRLKNLWDPWKCHIDDLPYLAWTLSVDIWDPGWNETKRRSVVASSLSNHRLKGTEEGIRRYISIVESVLLKAIIPPARGFYTPAMTEAMRRSWLQGLPQVRIYPFMTRRNAPEKRAFYRGPGGRHSFYRDLSGRRDDFMMPSEGYRLYGRRSTFFDRGIEIPAAYDVFQDPNGLPAERVRISTLGTKRTFYTARFLQDAPSFYGRGFWQASRAADNVISIRISADAARLYAAFTGAEITDINPERIYQPRVAPVGRKFYGRRKGYYKSTFGPNLIYDRITILDRDRLGERQKVRNFWGHSRYGIKPFSAELMVEVPMKRQKPVMGKFWIGHMKSADMSKLDKTLESIRVSKSYRDEILVDTQVHRCVQLGDVPKLGTFRLGEIRRLI